MRHYCTLFDSKYLPQGLALYESLKRHSSQPFTLYVLGMDRESMDTAIQLTDFISDFRTSFIYLPEFERMMGLKEARINRTWQEYCWTCASNLCEFLMKHHGIEEITYLDSDMLFFSDPEVIFEEIGDKSIAMIPHRFPDNDQRQRLEANGHFNVCWNTFRNTHVGRTCLSKWAAQCREWCYYRNEDGKFGDQKYLDSWPAEYGDEVHIIQNVGAGLAPWNLASYHLADSPVFASNPCIAQIRSDDMFLWEPVVFYHYHEYVHDQRLTNYSLRPEDIELIYKPYIADINAAKSRIESVRQLT